MSKNFSEVDELYQVILDYYESFAHLLKVGTPGEKKFAIDAFHAVQKLIAARLEKYSGEKKEQFLKIKRFLQQDANNLGDWMKETEEKIKGLKETIDPEIEKATKREPKKKSTRRSMEKKIRSKFS